MEEFYQLNRKLEEMSVPELYEYVKENYPEHEDIALGSKKLIIRRILNFERNKLNKLDENDQ